MRSFESRYQNRLREVCLNFYQRRLGFDEYKRYRDDIISEFEQVLEDTAGEEATLIPAHTDRSESELHSDEDDTLIPPKNT